MEKFVEGVDYRVNLRIDKYNSEESLKNKTPDEILNVPGNCLTNKGINLIWKLVANAPLVDNGTDGRWEWAFEHDKSFIGVGNADDNPPTSGSAAVASPTDEMLYAEQNYNPSDVTITSFHYCYMKMNDTYPLAGDNQKIVFQSTFLPGVACFNWYEWGIANGNGNRNSDEMLADPFIIRQGPLGPSSTPPNDIEDVSPDPVPSAGTSYDPVNTPADPTHKTLLNRRNESMGRKYASATWIITVEISLS